MKSEETPVIATLERIELYYLALASRGNRFADE